jgi:hypothetical protein
MKTFLAVATEKSTMATSAKVSLFVGSILALINYGDRIFLDWDMHAIDWVKIAITYCIPYCVATYGAARYAIKEAKAKKGVENTTN